MIHYLISNHRQKVRYQTLTVLTMHSDNLKVI